MNEVESDDDDMVKSTKVRTAGETTDTTEPETEYAESTQDTDEMPDKDKNRNETMKYFPAFI